MHLFMACQEETAGLSAVKRKISASKEENKGEARMQKLSSGLVKRILGAGLTQSELANLLQICRIQDSVGNIRGLSYKYTSSLLKKCSQTFYNAKNGLEEKGFIETSKDNRMDIDVFIRNNNFSDKDFSKGYIDLQMKIFDDEDFYKMPANAMALALELLRMRFNDETAGQGKPAEEFIRHYMDVFKVNERSIRRYLQYLRTYFNINCYGHKYFFELKSKWKKEKKAGQPVEEEKYRKQIAEAACRRARVINQTEDVMKDLKTLVQQYKKAAEEACKDISALVIDAVAESIARTNELVPKPKWNYKLSVPYVHIILRESLNLI